LKALDALETLDREGMADKFTDFNLEIKDAGLVLSTC
jgi:hypothetical protein